MGVGQQPEKRSRGGNARYITLGSMLLATRKGSGARVVLLLLLLLLLLQHL
jgi:hypothetical protein